MTTHPADHRSSPRPFDDRPWQVWVDLSLRTKLLLFALGLVTIPGAVFALIAFGSARAALEQEVGIQLHQAAEQGGGALAAALERAQSDARSWASQDVMRDLLIGDLDKRVSKFLRTVIENEPAYLEVVCAGSNGNVVAASSGKWIGRSVLGWDVMKALLRDRDTHPLAGPIASPEFGRAVLEIGVAIQAPDPPGDQIGTLVLVYDWDAVRSLLDGMRVKLANLEKHVAAIVVGNEGKVIGGVSFDGLAAERSPLAAEGWGGWIPRHNRERSERVAGEAPTDVLVGAARVSGLPQDWTVLFVERTAEALAAVRQVRRRWITVMAAILVAGLAVATLLARQVMRPLDEMTRATSLIASHPDREHPLLPVRSRNEVGQLTQSFNKMTIELKRSQDETLSAAQFAFAGELAAMVAHEVRTPLSVMRSSAQMLADSTSRRTVTNAELVGTIVAEVDRVEQVVTGLIQLARPLAPSPEATSLRDVLSRAAEFAAAHAEKQGIRIECEFADGGRRALCDSEQIYQVILNLLVNALQALPQGGSVQLRTLPERSGTVGFEVADDGPGLPHEIRERIFQPFVTGREGGTGLGLAFVDRVVKAHRGSVSVRSDPEQGTIFLVRLPVAEVAA